MRTSSLTLPSIAAGTGPRGPACAIGAAVKAQKAATSSKTRPRENASLQYMSASYCQRLAHRDRHMGSDHYASGRGGDYRVLAAPRGRLAFPLVSGSQRRWAMVGVSVTELPRRKPVRGPRCHFSFLPAG